MNTFCNWFSETIVISVYDLFFRNYISIVLLSFIVSSSQSQRLFIYVRANPNFYRQNKNINTPPHIFPHLHISPKIRAA